MHFCLRNRFVKLVFYIIIYVFFSDTISHAQNIGDFRSNGSGDWGSIASWQVFDGTNWAAATNYPGEIAGNYSVTINAGNVISTSGISTAPMGPIIINGELQLNGSNTMVTFYFDTPQISVTKGLTPSATIGFNNKSTLSLPANSTIKVWAGGLSSDCSNNQRIHIV